MKRPLRIAVIAEHSRAFTREMLAGIASAAQERDEWALELVDPAAFGHIDLSGYDAFIARILSDADANRLADTGKPVVDVFGRSDRLEFPCARPNNAIIGRLAAEHFLSRRFTSFAYCGYEGICYSDLRQTSFRKALANAGFGCSSYATPSKALNRFRRGVRRNDILGSDGDERQLAAWIRTLPNKTAVFCANDLKAAQLLSVIRASGRTVPENLAILGVDDDPILCSFSSPALSSVNPNAQAVGRRAAALLDLLLRGKRTIPLSLITPKGISTRSSSETYPIEPKWLSDALVFIHRSVSSNLSAAQVYAHVNLSHTTVDAAFRKTLGTSVQKEIAKARLEMAQRLIEAGELPLKQISQLAGFASHAYFTRAYSAAFGHPPSAKAQQGPGTNAE